MNVNNYLTVYLILAILILAVVIAAVGMAKYDHPQNRRKKK